MKPSGSKGDVMRFLVAVLGIFLINCISASAGCKIDDAGVLDDSVLTGIVRGFESGSSFKKGDDVGIYLVEPCDVFIAWTFPYPKSCKVGSRITAKGYYDSDIGVMFLADTVTCH